MANDKEVQEHYLHGDLLGSIQTALETLGKTVDSVTIDDLAPVDEFHIGGRQATNNFLSQLNFSAQSHILDVGCGLGGAARFVVDKYQNRVTGIDLTPEYITTGNVLCAWVKLDKQVTLQQGSALDMPFADATFDAAYMLHVGMNIEDKAQLFKEIYRVLRPGTFFGVYDVMRQREGELAYPVPWATASSTCSLATVDQYRQALANAGLEVSQENNRRDFALDFFQQLREKTTSVPALGLHTLMQESTAIKISNMIDNISADYIAPVEIIAKK